MFEKASSLRIMGILMVLITIVIAAIIRPLDATNTTANSTAYVESALDLIEKYDEIAVREFGEDAYLVELIIPLPYLGTDSTPRFETFGGAGYFSLTRPTEEFGIFVNDDGTIETEVFDHGAGPPQRKPIRKSDLPIDTPQLIEILSSQGVHLSNYDANECAKFSLRRLLDAEESLVWIIDIGDCQIPSNIQRITVDALTGEILKHETN